MKSYSINYSSLKGRYWILLTYLAAMTGLRMLIGATSALFLMSKGLPASDLFYLKGLQAVILLCLEIPLGLAADKFNRKWILLMGGFASSVWLFLTASADAVFVLYIAEACNAVSLAVLGAAGSSEYIHAFEAAYPQEPLRTGLMRNSRWSFTTMSAMILVSAVLASCGTSFLWNVAAASIFLANLLLLLLYSSSRSQGGEQTGDTNEIASIETEALQKMSVLKVVKESHQDMFILIVIFALLSVSYQIIIQYWQIFINQKSDTISTVFFSLIFFVIIFVQGRNKWLSRILAQHKWLTMLAYCAPIVVLYVAVQCSHTVVAVIFAIIVYFWVYQNSMVDLDTAVNARIDRTILATVLSLRSTLVRALLIVLAPVIAVVINHYGTSATLAIMLVISGIGVILFQVTNSYEKIATVAKK